MRKPAGKGLRLLLLAPVAGGLAGLALVGYFAWRPAPLPDREVAEARRAFATARLTPGIRPEDLARADSLGTVMEHLYARENGRLVRFRPSAGLARAVEDLRLAATAAESAAVARMEGFRTDRARRLQVLERRLETVAEQVETMPGAASLQRAFLKARLAVGGARELARPGSEPVPAAQLDSASAALARVEKLLDRRLARFEDPGLRKRWQSWADEAVATSRSGATAVLVDKQDRRCFVLRGGRVVAAFPAEFGRNSLANKVFAGDGATPEGQYRVVRKNASSRFSRALLLDYPGQDDLARHRAAAARGQVPAGAGPGGLIEIHGHGGQGADWTDGCIALDNNDMEALFGLVEPGSSVTIVGSARVPGRR